MSHDAHGHPRVYVQGGKQARTCAPDIVKAGLRKITVHDVRRTCASLLAALDVHPRVAMRIMRHAQIDMTMNVYTEVSDAKTLQALRRLAKQLDS